MDRPPESDHDLVAKARSGDREAYAELVRRYEQLAFRVAWLVCRSSVEAQDAAQEGFIKAHKALRRFRPDAEFRPWLLQIVANQARNRVRSAARRRHYEARAAADSSDAVPSAESAALRSDRRAELLAAVDRLPAGERVIVVCRYLLELSEAETAVVAGIPKGTVKSRLSRAMGRLREEVDRD